MKRRPSTPGDILSEDFLKPLKMTQADLAREMSISFQRVHEIVKGKHRITVGLALKLEKVFGATAEFWMQLQLACDLYDARKADR